MTSRKLIFSEALLAAYILPGHCDTLGLMLTTIPYEQNSSRSQATLDNHRQLLPGRVPVLEAIFRNASTLCRPQLYLDYTRLPR